MKEALTQTPPVRRRFRWRRWLAISAMSLVALFVGGRQWAWSARQAKFAELRQRGEPVFLADLGDSAPLAGTSTPPILRACILMGSDLNRSTVPRVRRLFTEAVPDAATMRPIGYDHTSIRSASAPFAKNVKIDTALAALAPVRELVARAVDLPPGRFSGQLNAENQFEAGSLFLPMAQALGELAKVQQSAVGQAVADHRPRDAYRELAVLLKMPRLLEREPFLIAFLMRLGLIRESCDTLERLVATADPTDAEFQLVDQVLTESADRLWFRPTILTERASLITALDRPGGFVATGWPTTQAVYLLVYKLPLCDARRWSDQRGLVGMFEEWLTIADDDGHGAMNRAAEVEKRLDAAVAYNPVLFHGLPGLSKFHTMWIQARTRLAAERIALRVHRFKMRFGKLPESLAELGDPSVVPTPLFGDKIPTYNRDSQGFTIGTAQKPTDSRFAAGWSAQIKYLSDPPLAKEAP